jgi:ATP-dependent RNA helicase DDX46/PRP5
LLPTTLLSTPNSSKEIKFLRLLQLLGEHVEEGKKVIVFVGTQAKADSIFEQLLRCGYVSLSLHGGKEREDRDSTISDFKSKDGPGLLVATGVAGRRFGCSVCTLCHQLLSS